MMKYLPRFIEVRITIHILKIVLGAIDGTHVSANIPLPNKFFIGRVGKNDVMQNVLTIYLFNICFIFAWIS